MPGGVAPEFGSEKVSRYTGVSQLQLRVSRYTVQLRTEQQMGAGEEADKRGEEKSRVAQEPNRNRNPEPSEPFSQEPSAEPEPPEPFSSATVFP